MSPTQSNRQRGPVVRTAGEDLSGKEGYLAEQYSNSGVPSLRLPTAQAVASLLLIVDDNVSGENVTAEPLSSEQQIRVRAKGAGSAGDELVLADEAVAADKGKLRELPVAAGTYRVRAIAEEDFVEGQLVLCRPIGPYDVVVS